MLLLNVQLQKRQFLPFPLDIDECLSDTNDNCAANAECTNTPGRFTCTCNQGYSGDGFNCLGELPTVGEIIFGLCTHFVEQ